MLTRSRLVAVAAITVACSSPHEIGTEPLQTLGSATTGATGSTSATTGSDTGGGAAGSSGSSASGGPGGSGGASVTIGSGGGDASAPTDATVDKMPVPTDATSPTQFPARIVFFYTPLGTVLESWRPAVPAKGEFTLPIVLKPLETFKDRILVVDGIDNLVHPSVPATTDIGPALLLTGKASADSRGAGGPSLGTLLGQKMGATTAFTSVQLGVQSSVAIDYGATFDGYPTINNPAVAASRLLGGLPNVPAFMNTDDFNSAGHQMMDIVSLVLRYDLTRVVSLSWGDIGGAARFSWIAGIDKDYRALATNSGVAGADRDHFIAAQTWFAQQFAYLANVLASTPEGNASLLDHTLLVWLSETGEASSGTGKNVPVVIAGNMYGRFRNGAYVQTTGSQLNLLSTIGYVAGLPAFGDAALGQAPLTALLNSP
jgi:hypothetical protein